MTKRAEYIWIDGASPTQKLRSKTRIMPELGSPKLTDFPIWNFDGSSTYQSAGDNSDLMLHPVCFVNDPIRGEGNFLVMCEVMNEDSTPHESNARSKLRAVLDAGAAKEDPWFGFEQEYTLFRGRDPLGWPKGGYPAPQGPFYCGVGADEVYGRPLVEKHTDACIDAGLMIYGTNAEVMPGQWEFQIGYRGFKGESANPLTVSDHLWISRWLLYRLGEDFNINATLHPKPVKGDWNGAGAHTNFSTNATRDEATGMDAIKVAITKLKKRHVEHIAVYGAGLSDRLTGQHETCSIDDFRSGVADRGASIRIPRHVSENGHGYLEDRRPGANADPYRVCEAILRTVCINETETASV
jgi:glutamine synthetase